MGSSAKGMPPRLVRLACACWARMYSVCKAMELALGYCGHRLSAQAEKKYNDELELKLTNRMKGVK